MFDPAAITGLPTLGSAVDVLAGQAAVEGGYGAKLDWARTRAADFRREFSATGTPDSVVTCDLVTLPYPTRFGLFRAGRAIAPFLSITNRMLVIRWRETHGRQRILLFEPSDVERGENTPYFAALKARIPNFVEKLAVRRHGTVENHLSRLGIRPEDVDYLMFDHLHTQDLRRWVGTGTRDAYFPNAKVIVQRDELAGMANLHPLQRPWYQVDAFDDVPAEAFLAADGGLLLGPGVAVIATPGHVFGNQTLVLNTSTGIWASSENAVAAECLTPEHSRIPGLARWSRAWRQEVVLNANTLETTADQYNSIILEKSIVDRSQADPRFPQFFPSSELSAAWTNPGTGPTFTHKTLTHSG
ncbi:hypothetical protein NLX83_38080 [Allokutzneria sp. A3M-2-11 16]|uniref:hypothetical protein n=1 Tax=Allokutzneria sp. A3M-2-11 16 TaxID=2962043 RepID=UPI0020B87779|nr:hypothetical protein [Allokutzneria sp. A3M-2-11 16]MCP3805090.1 hypothetical protein [Allokutzneria sp. A3M-2-11 16]